MAKILVLLALFTLSVNVATATTDDLLLHCPPMTTAMAAMEPCRQYLLQELMMSMAGGGVSPAMLIAPPLHHQLPSPVLRQQCCVQLQGMMPRCQCNAMCQMMQLMQQDLISAYPAGEQKMMMMRLRQMAMQLPYMCGTAPTYCQLFPGGGC